MKKSTVLKIQKTLLVIFWLCLQPNLQLSGQVNEQIVLTSESLKAGNDAIPLFKNWKYHPEDNLAWAEPEFDDSKWESGVDTRLRSGSLPQDGWTGIGWFRLHLSVDSTLWNQPLVFLYNEVGASEERCHSLREHLRACPDVPLTAEDHELAARRSNFA